MQTILKNVNQKYVKTISIYSSYKIILGLEDQQKQYNINSFRLRKSLPQMLAALIVSRSESGAPITTPILLEGGLFFKGRRPPSRRMGVVIGAPLSDLITIETSNICGKLFLSQRLFKLDLHACL